MAPDQNDKNSSSLHVFVYATIALAIFYFIPLGIAFLDDLVLDGRIYQSTPGDWRKPIREFRHILYWWIT